MKKIILLTALALSFYSALGQLRMSYAQITPDVFGSTLNYELDNGDWIKLKEAETVATEYNRFIDKYGEREFDRIMSLSFRDFESVLHSEKNQIKRLFMKKISQYRGYASPYVFKDNGDIYVLSYEPWGLGESYSHRPKVLEKAYNRDLNLYKWMGNNKWKKVNEKPIDHDKSFNQSFNKEHDVKYSMFRTKKNNIYNIDSKDYTNLDRDVTAMIVPIHYTYKKKKMMEVTTYKGDVKIGTKNEMRKVSRSGRYSQLILFIKPENENGFDIRVKSIKPRNLWYKNSNNLPNGENYVGVKDRNTIYFHFRTQITKEDGNKTVPSKTLKVEYNILNDKTKFIKR